jgi:hypothetical protein
LSVQSLKTDFITLILRVSVFKSNVSREILEHNVERNEVISERRSDMRRIIISIPLRNITIIMKLNEIEVYGACSTNKRDAECNQTYA